MADHGETDDHEGPGPAEYLAARLAEISLQPSKSHIRDLTLRSHDPCTAVLYDKKLLAVIMDGTREEVEAAIPDERVANAQNHTGETLLMKACRQTMNYPEQQRSWLIETLLDKRADAMVCCESKKTVLHDLIWTAKPPPDEVIKLMRKSVLTLQRYVGTQQLLQLCFFKDSHGHRPLDFLQPRQFEGWKTTIDEVLAAEAKGNLPGILAAASTEPHAGDLAAEKAADTIERVTTLKKTTAEIIASLDGKGGALMKVLIGNDVSFLMAECNDPDFVAVAVSTAFCELTQWEKEDVLGQNCRFLQGPGTELEEVGKLRSALASKGSCLANLLNYKKDGSQFRNNLAFLHLNDKQGNPAYVLGIQNCASSIYILMRESCRRKQSDTPVVKKMKVCPPLPFTPSSKWASNASGCMTVMPGHKTEVEILESLDRRSQAFLVYLIEHAGSFLLSDYADPDCKIVACSEAFEALTLFSHNEVLGRNCRFLQGKDTCVKEVEKIRTALRSGASTRVCVMNYRKDGSQFMNDFALIPLRDMAGELVYFAGVQNVTENMYNFIGLVLELF